MNSFNKKTPKPTTYQIPSWILPAMLGVAMINMEYGLIHLDALYPLMLSLVFQKRLDGEGCEIPTAFSIRQKLWGRWLGWALVWILVLTNIIVKHMEKSP